jgi:cGMP-dependent protein kinase 1
MGNCFSSPLPKEPDLLTIEEPKTENAVENSVQTVSNHNSFPPGLERKLVKSKAPVIDKRVEDSIIIDAPEALMVSKTKTQEDFDLLHKCLNKHFIFKNLSQEQQDLIMHEMKFYTLPQFSIIVEQGKPGNNFFVISSGSVEVLVNKKRVNTLNPGDSFGEMALLQDRPRSASVKTLEETNLWGVDRVTFRQAVQAINAANYTQNKNFIETVPIFQALTSLQKELLVSSLSTVNYTEGQKIVNEGDTGDLFYLIKEGTVKCTRNQVFLRTMGMGEYFGEQALLYGTPRTATITSVGDAKCLVIGREDLTRALGSQLTQIIYRNSIRMALDKSKYFKNIPDSQAKSLINLMAIRSYDPDSTVIPQDTFKNSALYIILNGQLKNTNQKIVAEILNILGEEELKNNTSQVYDQLIAVGRVDVAVISKENLIFIVGENFDKVAVNSEVLKVLKKVNLFRGLREEKLKNLLELLKVQEFSENQIIFAQHTSGDSFFIIKSGKVDVIINDSVLRTINKLDYFGERSILFNELRTATVKAQTKVECWVLQKSDFFGVIDERMRLMLQKRIQLQDENIALDDLIIVKKLGHGMFGNVFLSVHKSTKNLYALKTIDRKKIDNEKIQDSLILERKILMQLDHMLILKLIKTFKDTKRLYFLLEYVRGQDLFDVIRELGLVSNEDSKFYAACLVIILEHLHERDIVYRDLKPENVMVDEEGYPKLIDFGTAKIVQGRTYTMIGTPHYMAPEVILGKGYGISADYWSLGIMIYEFACGGVPFGESESDSYLIYEKVLEAKITYPNYARPTTDMKILIEQLLNKNSALRSGGSIKNLKSHLWLKDVDWDGLMEKKEKPPYVPVVPNLVWDVEKVFKNPKNINHIISYEEKGGANN